ncbi:Na+/H+ antiporter NhaC family protein [Jeotgalibaca sp. A122]|uniref:Na+/H+ antiporter NhaC family protein n=1 Tax=Jeotgalibaca sp. A122 TaxID=3457322 RepID=UPI003FD2486B
MNKQLAFRGGRKTALIPVIIFLFFCVLYFIVFKAFEMYALAMGGFVALLAGALFVKKGSADAYWESVYAGAKEAIPIAVLLFIIGMFSQLIKTANISGGFVWIASYVEMNGGMFTAFTFLTVCIIATATGSSIGTIFTCFPLFYPAGVLLGSDPVFLAGAIVSGAIFGDNLAPISDTTIISSGTQTYMNRTGPVDVAGCVTSRFQYSAVAGIISFFLFWLLGGNDATAPSATAQFTSIVDPTSLVMLVPVAFMLVISVKTRDIYKAITVGLITGTLVGLGFDLISPSAIINVANGVPGGFLTDGVSAMMGTVTLILSVYGIMGVLNGAGVIFTVTDRILESRLGRTVAGAEVAMMLGITLTTLLFGGVTSASMATFGKVQNELGKRVGLHPYRRANLLDGFANALPVTVPFLSVFVFLGSLLTQGYDFVEPLRLTDISKGMIYSFVLFFTLLISIIMGWGRQYEGPSGEPVKRMPVEDLTSI